MEIKKSQEKAFVEIEAAHSDLLKKIKEEESEEKSPEFEKLMECLLNSVVILWFQNLERYMEKKNSNQKIKSMYENIKRFSYTLKEIVHQSGVLKFRELPFIFILNSIPEEIHPLDFLMNQETLIKRLCRLGIGRKVYADKIAFDYKSTIDNLKAILVEVRTYGCAATLEGKVRIQEKEFSRNYDFPSEDKKTEINTLFESLEKLGLKIGMEGRAFQFIFPEEVDYPQLKLCLHAYMDAIKNTPDSESWIFGAWEALIKYHPDYISLVQSDRESKFSPLLKKTYETIGSLVGNLLSSAHVQEYEEAFSLYQSARNVLDVYFNAVSFKDKKWLLDIHHAVFTNMENKIQDFLHSKKIFLKDWHTKAQNLYISVKTEWMTIEALKNEVSLKQWGVKLKGGQVILSEKIRVSLLAPLLKNYMLSLFPLPGRVLDALTILSFLIRKDSAYLDFLLKGPATETASLESIETDKSLDYMVTQILSGGEIQNFLDALTFYQKAGKIIKNFIDPKNERTLMNFREVQKKVLHIIEEKVEEFLKRKRFLSTEQEVQLQLLQAHIFKERKKLDGA